MSNREQEATRNAATDRRDKWRLGVEIATLVIVVAYTCVSYRQWRSLNDQLGILKGQLDVMRRDQRPWMVASVGPTPFYFHKGGPIIADVRLVNSGKSPARMITAQYLMKKVINGEDPPLLTSDYAEGIGTGSIAPNIPHDSEVFLKVAGTQIQALATEEDVRNYNDVRTFYELFGYVEYSDLSNHHHWTKFCFFLRPANKPEAIITADRCGSYNDMDND